MFEIKYIFACTLQIIELITLFKGVQKNGYFQMCFADYVAFYYFIL